jgi:alpha-mannosidase
MINSFAALTHNQFYRSGYNELKFQPRILFTAFFLMHLLLVESSVHGQEPVKHLYLGNDTHTDLMWNGDEEKWYKMNLDMARFYLQLGENTRDNPPEAQSKWNYDVAWTLYMLEKNAPEEFFNRIIGQIKNGQASVPYNFTLPVYGASTMESVLRSFYFAGRFERKYHIDIDLAICQENATIPLGLASLWAGSGAKYSWRGVCNCATHINTIGIRDHEIYWYTGLDGSRILMKWYSSFGWNAELGGYSEMLEPTVAVIQMDSLCGSRRYPYHIAGAFGKGWDNMYNYSYDLVWGLKQRTLPGTRVILSNQSDFFREFESAYGDQLPEVTLAYGNEWDLNLASLAEVNAELKRSMEKLRSAEAMAAFLSVQNEGLFEELLQAKEDFLYGISVFNLHGWTADGPVDRHDFAVYMRNQQKKVTDYVDALYSMAVEEMGKKIIPEDSSMIFVFNSLNWERKGLVEIPVRENHTGVRDIETGETCYGSMVQRDGAKILRVWVDNVPSVGYKVFQLTNEESPTAESKFDFRQNQLETPYYSVRISRSGAISELRDKKTGKNWSRSWLNDPGSSNHEAGELIRVVTQCPEYITLRCESADPVKHVSVITFYAEDPRIDFQNIIQENFSGLLHWSFDLNLENPSIWHEEVGAVINAKTASAGGHYADRMARYDYLTLNHFVNAGNEHENITLSNADCLFFRLGQSTPDFLDMNSSVIHVLVGGQVNKKHNLGVINQDGDTLFHQNFSLLPQNGGFDAGSSMRFSLEHQNPLVAGPVHEGGEWPGMKHSFLGNDQKNVVLWTIKPGEDEGMILRWWNMGSKPVNTNIKFSSKIQRAINATHVETDLLEIPSNGELLSLQLNQHQLKTFRIQLK